MYAVDVSVWCFLQKEDEKRVCVCVCVCALQMKSYRRVLRVIWTDKRSNEWVLQKLGLHNILPVSKRTEHLILAHNFGKY